MPALVGVREVDDGGGGGGGENDDEVRMGGREGTDGVRKRVKALESFLGRGLVRRRQAVEEWDSD